MYDAQVGGPVGNPFTLMQTLTDFERQLPALAEGLPDNASMGDAIARYLDQENLEGGGRRLAAFALEQLLIELYDASPPGRTSLRHYGDYEELGGGDQLIEGGYVSLVEALAHGLDVRLGERVRRIEHSDEGVTVFTEAREFRGSHAIVTVPLGVLKAGSIEFHPPLPPEKLAAIGRLEMGNLEKVILRFETAFWREDEGLSHFAYIAREPGDYPAFLDFTEHAGAPTLVCLIGGDSAQELLDTKTDAEIAARACEVLAEIFGPDVPTSTRGGSHALARRSVRAGLLHLPPRRSEPRRHARARRSRGRALALRRREHRARVLRDGPRGAPFRPAGSPQGRG